MTLGGRELCRMTATVAAMWSFPGKCLEQLHQSTLKKKMQMVPRPLTMKTRDLSRLYNLQVRCCAGTVFQ